MKKILLSYAFLSFVYFSVYASGTGDLNAGDTLFNEALSSYKQSDYEKTGELLKVLYEESDGFDVNEMMLSANNSYRLSLKNMESPGGTDKALDNIENSIGFYERLLQDRGNDPAVAHNLELSLLLKEKIKETSREEQKQQEQNKSDQNKVDQLQEKQENLASDSQKEADDHKSDQEDLNTQTSEMKNQSSSSQNEQFNEKMEKAEEAQQKAVEAIKNKDFEQAEEHQKDAAQYLKEASESLGEGSETEPEHPDESGDSESDNQNESDQIAKSIIENENNRESSSDKTSGGIIVDRNW